MKVQLEELKKKCNLRQAKCCATCLHYTSCGGGGGKCHNPMLGCTINVEGHNFCEGWKTKNM